MLREVAPTVLAETGTAEQAAKAADAKGGVLKLGPKGTEAPVSHGDRFPFDKTVMEVQSKSHSIRM